MNKTEIVAVTLANGDCALYLNGNVVYSVEACDKGDPANPVELGIKMATALEVTPHAVEMAVPKDEDWNWEDVYELLPPFVANDEACDQVVAAHWNAARYGGELDPRAEYAMRVSDRRETSGQMFIDIAPKEGHTDDLGIGIVVEVNNTPGDEDSQVPCVHVNFGNGNLAFSIFQAGLDKLVLRPETRVGVMSGEILPNNEHAWCVREV